MSYLRPADRRVVGDVPRGQFIVDYVVKVVAVVLHQFRPPPVTDTPGEVEADAEEAQEAQADYPEVVQYCPLPVPLKRRTPGEPGAVVGEL